MSEIFLEVLNTGIMAGWLVLAVLLARLLLKNAPAWAKCALWAIVGLRLIWPFELESILSLVPSAQTLPPEELTAPAPQVHTGIPSLNSAINPSFAQAFQPESAAGVNPLQVVVTAASVLWVIGMVAMAVYSLVSYLRLRRRVRVSMPVGEGVYLCDAIASPFILGIIKPKIYLPSDLPQEKWEDILSHERAHLARRDHWWKPLGFALLTVFWFHPLLWVGYILLCRDVELACDEKVIKTLTPEEKQAYSQTLLECSMPRKWITACPLAFGETSVKTRIKAVLHYKKPTLWIIIATLALCAVLAVCFLTEPQNEPDEPVTAADVAGKLYLYEKEGFGSPFYIHIYEDGTFQYYVGALSSHIGRGEWELKDSKLYLYDTTLQNTMTFVFSVQSDALLYIAAESYPFMYMHVADGDHFNFYREINMLEQMEKHLTFVEVTEIHEDHFLAIDAKENIWHIEYSCEALDFDLEMCWVSYYGQPETNEAGEYSVRAADCWLYREGDGGSGTIFDSCIFDVDGDGTAETCCLTSQRMPSLISSFQADRMVYKLVVQESDGTQFEADFLELLIPDENSFGTTPLPDWDYSQIDRVYAYAEAFTFAVENGQLLILMPRGSEYIETGEFTAYKVTFANDTLIVTAQ